MGDRRAERWTPPLLRPRPAGWASRLAGWLPGWHPAAVFAVALVAGFVVVGVVSTLVGTLITEVVLEVDWFRRADEAMIDALAGRRSAGLTDVSTVVSGIGGGPVLASLAGLVALVAAVRRNWLLAAFVAFLLPIETAGYRLTLNLVPRSRPAVERLDDLPVGGSYPSGHTAASVAVYVGFALLVASAGSRRSVVALGVALAVLVALSRLYRGMHHPLDVAGGAFVGIGTLAIVIFACRAAQAAMSTAPTSAASRVAP